MKPEFPAYPLGHSISGSPHSMCVSLPRIADVIGYEEKQPAILAALRSGYPRFFRNPLISRLIAFWQEQGLMASRDPLLADFHAAAQLCEFVGLPESAIAAIDPFWTVRLPADAATCDNAAAFLRHTGAAISSREAEAVLHRHGIAAVYPETRAAGSASSHDADIRQHLKAAYGAASSDDIRLYRSGMNAFYAGFRALQQLQSSRGKDLWIQLGWLYVDTARILERFSANAAQPIQLYPVLDLAGLHQALQQFGTRVAGIVTEVPTNPLVQTPDLAALRALADRHHAALILDPTLVSPHNVNVLSFADLHVNSLTKYAAAEADVMMGALALNPQSRFYADLMQNLHLHGSAPAAPDLARMAAQIGNYASTVCRINANTRAVVGFLQQHPLVKRLHWAMAPDTAANFAALQHRCAGPGAIITFSLAVPLATFYDRCSIVKSPSFGARFTLMCPFMYLAHYDWVSCPEGRRKLLDYGLDPELIRLSVGTEDAAAIIAQLDAALSG